MLVFKTNRLIFIVFYYVKIPLPVKDGGHFNTPSIIQLKFLAVALYQIFITTFKTTFSPNFVFLTESEQFQHISAPLICNTCVTFSQLRFQQFFYTCETSFKPVKLFVSRPPSGPFQAVGGFV